MRFLIIVAVSLISFAASAQSSKKNTIPALKFPENKYFKIDSAVINRLYPGVYGAPIVNNITVYFKTKVNCGQSSKVNLQLDSFWMQNKGGQLNAVLNKSSEPLRKGSSFRGIAHVEFPTRTEEIPVLNGVTPPQEAAVTPPIKFKGDMLIRYKIAGKSEYLTITKFKEGVHVYAP